MTNDSVFGVYALAGQHFFYFSDDGGRIIKADRISTIIPNFKSGGSMVFLVDTSKAIAVDATPNEIAHRMEEMIRE